MSFRISGKYLEPDPFVMDQQALNQQEWSNPSNWRGPRWMSIYCSKRDSRVWIRKRPPLLEWRIYFGNPTGVVWFVGIMLVGNTIAIAVIAVSGAGGGGKSW